jgi:hypothetical protein
MKMEMLKSQNISIRGIFLCHRAWLLFWTANILLLRWSIVWNVAKMLLCRNGLGYHEYSCPKCGSKKRIPHTCKSRFCSSCGKVATDKWVETSLSQTLDVEYKHLVFTLPEQFRDWFLQNRKACLDAFFIAVKDTLLDYAEQRGFRPGVICVLHTFGSDLKWNPHIHVIITAGGLSLQNDQWVKCHYLPQNVIRPIYRYQFLQQFKKLFKQGLLKPPPAYKNIKSYQTFNSWLTQFYKKEWYVNLGKTLRESGHTLRYVGRYSKRPVIAEYRIEAFDGYKVTFLYKDHSTDQIIHNTVTVEEFISRLVRHIPDQNFRNIRHSGIFANRVRTKLIATARILLNQTPKPKPLPLSFSQRYKKTFNINPLACNNCGTQMVLSHVVIVHTCTIRERVENKHQELIQNYHDQKEQKEKNSTLKPRSP